MTSPQLLLHIAQAHKALLRTQNNHYSDKSKQAYQENLVRLFYAIEKDVVDNPPQSEKDVYELKSYIDFIFKNIEFLDSSTLNLIPYEIVACLKSTLVEWINDPTFIITTSLINDTGGFSFDPSLITFYKRLYYVFQLKYGVEFAHKLIQINIPKAFSRDYLVSVVHYHELGHFVDTQNKITEALAKELFNDFVGGKYDDDEDFNKNIGVYFEFIHEKGYSDEDKVWMLKNHLAEYFCDLFASQYVGPHLSDYIIYITEGQNYYADSHPSSTNRKKVVADFLSNVPNLAVTLVNQALRNIFNKQLEIRYEAIPPDDFYQLLPFEIANDKQLHGLISTGWQIWNDGHKAFEQKAGMQDLSQVKFYSIINNLIEKAIGNYIISQTWTQI